MSTLDTTSFLLIMAVAAAAALAVALLPRSFGPPVVVIELLAGIAIGPHGLGLAETDEVIRFFASLGLALLFFFAGYEIDLGRIRGRPLQLGAWGWLLSVVLASGSASCSSPTGSCCRSSSPAPRWRRRRSGC